MLLHAGMSLLYTAAFVALMLWARRGRRVDRHPVCRKCRYDLHGIELESFPDCPECGAQIVSRKDLRLGNRQPRRLLMYTFGLLVLLGLVATIGSAGLWAKDYDWNRMKPVSWLIDEAMDTTQPNRMDAAMSELYRRVDESGLSEKAHAKLVAAAINYQSDQSKPWDRRWGRFVARARIEDIATDQQWQRYATQAREFELLIREKLHPGDPVIIAPMIRTERLEGGLASMPIVDPHARYELRKVVDGKASGPSLITFIDGFYWNMKTFHGANGHGLDQLPPGRYELSITKRHPCPFPYALPDENPTLYTTPDTISARFEVLPSEEPLFKPVKDQQAAESLRNDLTTIFTKYHNAEIRYNKQSGRFFVSYSFDVDTPHFCSFDTHVVINGKTIEYTYDMVIASTAASYASVGHRPSFTLPAKWRDGYSPDNPPTIDAFTLRLIPNPEHLKEELDGYNYLDHVIEIKDIPIQPYQPE